SVDCVMEFHAEAVMRVEPAGSTDQTLRELGIDAPVARFVRIGQRRTAHGLAKAHVVELLAMCRQTRLDVAQTLAVGELREGHRAKLFRACERSGSMIAAVALHDALEARPGQKIHQLRKQRLASIHTQSSGKGSREPRRHALLRSSRHHSESQNSLVNSTGCALQPSS